MKFISSNIYKTSDKIIINLVSMFSKYNLITKNNALIYSFNFYIKIKKTFNEFIVRFITAIASLSLSEV